jgi:hypothetical protein
LFSFLHLFSFFCFSSRVIFDPFFIMNSRRKTHSVIASHCINRQSAKTTAAIGLAGSLAFVGLLALVFWLESLI